MNEIWRDIAGYEGYQVSNTGRVRSLNYRRTGQTQVLKPRNNGTGYLQVALCRNGEQKMFLLHRLVAEAFIPNPMNLPQINHRNEVKTDNRVDNLEFCSAKYNQNYGSCRKRIAAKLAGGHSAKSVLQFDKSGNLVKTWPSMLEVERQTGFNSVGIFYCCNGKLKSYKGYIWKYAP